MLGEGMVKKKGWVRKRKVIGGKEWERMGRDGKGWKGMERMGRDGKGWKGIVRVGIKKLSERV